MRSPNPRVKTRIGAATILSLALAGTVVVCTPSAGQAVGTDPSLIARFTFDDAISGLSGAGATATPQGDLVLVDGANGSKAVQTSRTSWLDVKKDDGTALLADLNDITISYDSMPAEGGGNNGWAFVAQRDTNTTTYGYEHYLGVIDTTNHVVVERYDNNSGIRDTSGNLTADGTPTSWKHVDVVVSGPSAKVFVDGRLRASTTSGKSLTSILGSTGGVLQLGKADWTNADEYFKGLLDNVEVRNRALTDGEIRELAVLNALERLPDELTIEDDTYELPGADGVVKWTSQVAGIVISADGRTAQVTRPIAGSPDTTGTLTASVTVNGEPRTKQVQVVVPALPTEEQKAEQALTAISIPDLHDVRSSLVLPTTGAHGLPIVWTSSDPAVISPVATGGVAPGVVTRGEKDQAVTLTATVSGRSRTFTALVRAAVSTPRTTDYLFAHFTGFESSPSDEQIYFATSEDGDTWTDTRLGGQPVLRSDKGDGGVRDPYLIRSPEGDTFYLIATDLSINLRGGWCCSGATETGSRKLAVWKSTDLVNWGQPRLVDVASMIPDAGMAWAPEAIWDPVKMQYVVYWATKSQSTNTLGDWVNVYYATTRDFETFSSPVKWIDREHSIIDTTVIKVGDWYYRASGDGQITLEKSKDLYASSTSPLAADYSSDDQWSRVGTLQEIFDNDGFTGAQLEGPEFFEYNQDDRRYPDEPLWGLLADRYSTGGGYFPFRTTGIGTPNTSAWSVAGDVSFGGLTKRHGTILPITRSELDAVKAAAERPGLLVDTTAPTLTVSPSPAGAWHRTAPALDVTAEDAGGRTPSVWVRLGDGAWQPYLGGPLSGLTNQPTIVSVRAEDSVGNYSLIRTLTLGLDSTPPTGSAILNPVARTVDVSSADSSSGVAKVEYSLDGSTWTPYNAPVPVGAGAETFRYRITDGAGNQTVSEIEVPGTGKELSASTPRIAGTARVGATLTAAPGRWTPAPVDLKYQWLRAGSPIPGATGATYRVVPADHGQRLAIAITGTKAGYSSLTATSPQTAPVAVGRFTTGRPTIDGPAEVGHRLSAVVEEWDPAPERLTYQWSRAGVDLDGATGSTYIVQAADRGARIAVTVIGSSDGFEDTVRRSKETARVR